MFNLLPAPITSSEGVLVQFDLRTDPVIVRPYEWVGFDFDGVLSMHRPGANGNLKDLGVPVPSVVAWAKRLLNAGVKVKVFTARACEPESICGIQDWTEQCGLGRLEVTNAKDFGLIRYYDDRAIQIPTRARAEDKCGQECKNPRFYEKV